MLITFNELRRIKDRLPSGSMQKIAQILGIQEDTIRNYFGGEHLTSGRIVGIHYESGPDGGIVRLEDETIYHLAMEILAQEE